MFHILQKNIGRKTGTSENHLHQIFLSSLYSSGKKKIYIPATRNPERVQLYQNHGLFPSWRKNYFLTYSVTSRSVLVAFFLPRAKNLAPHVSVIFRSDENNNVQRGTRFLHLERVVSFFPSFFPSFLFILSLIN